MITEQEYIGGIPIGQYLKQQRQRMIDDTPMYMKIDEESDGGEDGDEKNNE